MFASYREKVGSSVIEVDLTNGSTVEGLVRKILERYPLITGNSETFMVAVNQEFQSRDRVLHEDDEVALIPPVSGGESCGGWSEGTRSRGVFWERYGRDYRRSFVS